MLITKIEKLKDNKYKIIVDGEKITTFDNVILDNNLLYKKNIDINLYNKIIEETKYYDIYNKTIKYILKRRRSEKEIREYLIKQELEHDKIEETILKLKNINLINDLEYCKAYINDCVYLSKKGINKIKSDLLSQDISIHVIENILQNIDVNIFNNRLEKAILKKINSNKKYSNFQLKQKILNEMMNLGYEKEKILNILDNNLIDNSIIAKKEFDKLYNKLSKKYSGEELFKNIKTKLLTKGFNLGEINKFIQEKTEE